MDPTTTQGAAVRSKGARGRRLPAWSRLPPASHPASSHDCLICGYGCLICGHDCLICGNDCLISGHDCPICGHDCLVCGHGCLIWTSKGAIERRLPAWSRLLQAPRPASSHDCLMSGHDCRICGHDCLIRGHGCIICGHDCLIWTRRRPRAQVSGRREREGGVSRHGHASFEHLTLRAGGSGCEPFQGGSGCEPCARPCGSITYVSNSGLITATRV